MAASTRAPNTALAALIAEAHWSNGNLAVRSVGPRPELDPSAVQGRTYRQVGEGVTAHDTEGKPALAFGGQVGPRIHGQLAEAGQEAGEPQVQIGERHAVVDLIPDHTAVRPVARTPSSRLRSCGISPSNRSLTLRPCASGSRKTRS